MIRVETVGELRTTVAGARAEGKRVALVPTMGALHGGHLALVRRAHEHVASDGPGFVVVSIFVNPMQFAPHEDYETYPRDLSGDEAALSGLGATAPDLVYTPSVSEMYPQPALTTVSVAELSRRLEGTARPGHFDGVCVVVSKLLNQVRPDAAFFGRKDYQQLQIIRRMVADLDLPAEIIDVPTVRETDGLAMSSRNVYLTGEDRRAARCLSRALAAAVCAARTARAAEQAPEPDVLRRAALATIRIEPRARVDYVEVADPDTLAPPDEGRGEVSSGPGGARGSAAPQREPSASPPAPQRGPEPARERCLLLVAVAVRIGQTRLIDNVVVGDLEDERLLLEATS
ncbi:MAG: pantoate--beta-alanine ligase [Actinomycetota bacterium]|nr:pantoate--beta-alanine ligase [Actinomycetota bacterium]